MNQNNLISLATRTEEEKTNIAKQGGLKSGKTRLAKSYNTDILKILDLEYEIELIKNNNYFVTLSEESKKVLLEIKKQEITKLQEITEQKKNKYNLKYKSDIDSDIDKIIEHLNRKYLKAERRLLDE